MAAFSLDLVTQVTFFSFMNSSLKKNWMSAASVGIYFRSQAQNTASSSRSGKLYLYKIHLSSNIAQKCHFLLQSAHRLFQNPFSELKSAWYFPYSLFPPEIIIMILSLPLIIMPWAVAFCVVQVGLACVQACESRCKKKPPKKPSLPTTVTLSEKWEVILSWLHFTALLWKQTVHFICRAELEVLKITSCLPDNKSYYSIRKWAPFECSRSTHPVIGETAI